MLNLSALERQVYDMAYARFMRRLDQVTGVLEWGHKGSIPINKTTISRYVGSSKVQMMAGSLGRYRV